MKKFILIQIFLLSASLLYAQDFNYDAISKIAIQHGGRYKPLDTYAKEVIKYITGSERFTSRQPMHNLLELATKSFVDAKLIKVTSSEVKDALTLDRGQDFFSLTDFRATKDKLIDIVREASKKRNNTRLEKATLELYNKISTLHSLFDGSGIRIIPVPIEESRYWLSVMDLEDYLDNSLPQAPHFEMAKTELDKLPRQKLVDILAEYKSLKKSFTENNTQQFYQASQNLYGLLIGLNPAAYPSENELLREVDYNKLDPVGKAWLIYLVAFALFLASAVIRKKALYIFSVLVILCGVAFHIYGMVLRWQISGRQPWSNMYESMTLLCLGIVVISMAFEFIYRNRIFGIVSSLMSAVGLVFANSFTPFSQSINPLMPALKSNWMTIHTPCIIQGYVSGTILMAVGHVFLFTYIFSPHKREFLMTLDNMMYRVLQVATIFTLAGTCLGAVWGGEAWGRYWGWDMKENWALITLLGFLATLHCRKAKMIGQLGTAIASVFCFALVALTYYGVNLVFGQGLHTYGFGAADYLPIVVFSIFELLLVTVAITTYLARRRYA